MRLNQPEMRLSGLRHDYFGICPRCHGTAPCRERPWVAFPKSASRAACAGRSRGIYSHAGGTKRGPTGRRTPVMLQRDEQGGAPLPEEARFTCRRAAGTAASRSLPEIPRTRVEIRTYDRARIRPRRPSGRDIRTDDRSSPAPGRSHARTGLSEVRSAPKTSSGRRIAEPEQAIGHRRSPPRSPVRHHRATTGWLPNAGRHCTEAG